MIGFKFEVAYFNYRRKFHRITILNTSVLIYCVSASTILLVIDIDGYGMFVSLAKGVVMLRKRFKEKVTSACFSPDGKYFAVTRGRRIEVWKSPTSETNWKIFLVKLLFPHADAVSHLSWSSDSKALVSCGMDTLVKV